MRYANLIPTALTILGNPAVANHYAWRHSLLICRSAVSLRMRCRGLQPGMAESAPNGATTARGIRTLRQSR
jgi:hypothetical protein